MRSNSKVQPCHAECSEASLSPGRQMLRCTQHDTVGDAYPDFLLISKESRRPQVVIEAKADENDFDKALGEALHYGNACRAAGHDVIAIGIAGQEHTKIQIGNDRIEAAFQYRKMQLRLQIAREPREEQVE